MNYLTKVLLTTAIALSLVAIAVSFKPSDSSFGSVNFGNEYYATSTVGMSAVMNPVKTGAVTLGSVIVASTTAFTFTIWNATSTTDTASTTWGHFSTSPANGTYTFDASLPRGIVVQTPTGFAGDYVITYR